MDESAVLRFRLNPNECEAKTERGILLKQADYDCAKYFHVGETDGVVATARVLDREFVETIALGVIVEDVASDTSVQLDTGRF